MPDKKTKTKTTKKTNIKVGKVDIEKSEKSQKQLGLKIDVYDKHGKKVGQEKLDPKIFGVEVKKEVIHQVVISMMSNKRHPWAHTKTRGEVRGGGRKPWKQKGTGRARAGSIRSPIWKGGGVTFGPRKERNYYKKINKKMRRKALLMCLSDKFKENKLYVLDKLQMTEIKTKDFNSIISKVIKPLVKTKIKKVIISLPENDLRVIKSARNIPGVKTFAVTDLNVLDVLKTKYILTTRKGIKKIQTQFEMNKE